MRGNAYNNMGDYKNAIESCNIAIKLNPNDAYAFNNRGIAYNNMGMYLA